MINTDSNATGTVLASPLPICPGQSLTLMATVSNLSQFSRSTDLRIYADVADNCTTLDGVGTELSYSGACR